MIAFNNHLGRQKLGFTDGLLFGLDIGALSNLLPVLLGVGVGVLTGD
jgi:hypothetical protein